MSRLAQLSPFLTLLDCFAGHSSPMESQPPPADPDAAALWDMAAAPVLQLRWLRAAWATLQPVLATNGLMLTRRSASTQLELRSAETGEATTCSRVAVLAAEVEEGLAKPAVVLARLQVTVQCLAATITAFIVTHSLLLVLLPTTTTTTTTTPGDR